MFQLHTSFSIVLVMALCPSQQVFSHVGTEPQLPGNNPVLWVHIKFLNFAILLFSRNLNSGPADLRLKTLYITSKPELF